ncbi:CrcB family protein [Teichococcus wenyumeiae]|nr:CrcB family protein [Pseudoroseomonas wenyumeiae]
MSAVVVFVGGGLGAIVRELFMLMLGRYSTAFPLDIFMANILACFLLGIVSSLHQERRASDGANLLLATGFCGGMSTFSSFVFGAFSETMTPGRLVPSILYIIASLVVGYGAAWVGLRSVTRKRRA